jgi:hypothetical protein
MIRNNKARVRPPGNEADRLPAANNSFSIIRLALLLLGIFLAIYSLTYSGTFITDDEQILASRAMSIAFDGTPNDFRVYGNSRVFALSNLMPEQAIQAVNIEPGQQIIGALLAHISDFLPVGRVQFMFMLNVWVTALTVMAVFGIVVLSGYRSATALIVSFLFGLGTIAWPYARTYFRDPLATLFLTLAWGCVVILNRSWEGESIRLRRIDWLAGAGLVVFIIAGILSKNTIALAIPIIFLALIPVFKRYWSSFRLSQRGFHTSKRLMGRVLLIVVSLMLSATIWVILSTKMSILARFTPAYYISLVKFFFTTPHPHLLEALTGPFISPGKSIFLYSPVLILAFIALIRRPRIAGYSWLYLIFLVIGQALFYDGDWWGHINWGLRFTLPAIPLMLIATAPVVENWLGSKIGWMGFAIIGGLSAVVQLIGLLPPIQDFYIENAQAIPSISNHSTVWSMIHSALVWHVRYLLSGGKVDLAIARAGTIAIPIVLGLIIVVLLSILGFSRTRFRWFPIVTISLVMVIEYLMLLSYVKDPAYYASRADLVSAESKITSEYHSGDLVLIKSYSTPAWFYWMNWASSRQLWISLPFTFPTPDQIDLYNKTHDPEIALDKMTLSLLRNISSRYARVWLVLPDDSPGSTLGLELNWLENSSISADQWDFPADGGLLHLYLFITR